MIACDRRLQLSKQIHSLIAGVITNDNFDDWLIENDYCAVRDPGMYDDAALGPIVERAYCLHSDMPTYKLTGKRKLDRQTYQDASINRTQTGLDTSTLASVGVNSPVD